MAEGTGGHGARHIAQPDRADGDPLDHPPVVFADIDDIADRDLILEQDEKTGDDVLDERLTAKADRQTDNPGPGEQRGDVDTDMGEDDQRGQGYDHAQHRRAQKRQQCTYARPLRRARRVDRAQIPLDRNGDDFPYDDRDDDPDR